MYARTIIVGRLGRDPEMRYTPDGTPVCTFSVATDRGFGDKKTTVWYRVTAWRKTAEACNSFLSKGRMVLVEGELAEPKPYQGKDKEWRASLDVTALNVKFLGGRDEASDTASEPTDLGDEDLPF